MFQRRWVFMLVALIVLLCRNSAFAQPTQPAQASTQKVAQFDADDSYDPFADYSEFDEDQEEEEDINFFRNGRFLTLGLMLGMRGFTETLGDLVSPAVNYGLALSYFFDLRFALQFSFVTGDHSFGFTTTDGSHSANVGIQNFGFDLKYYVNTQNVTKGLAKFNPYILVGLSEIFRTVNSTDTSAYGKDNATGFDIGGGVELPLMRNKMYWGVQAMYQQVTFPDASTELVTANQVHTGIYPHGSTYSLLGTLGVNF